MPTEKAHGLQITKMCEAFAKIVDEVELVVPYRRNTIDKDVFTYYSIPHNYFLFKQFQIPDIIQFSSILGSVAYRVQMLVFIFRLLFVSFPDETLIYTRDPEIAWLFGWRGYRVVCEIHQPPQSKQRIFKYFLSLAQLVVCNSDGTQQALANMGVKNTIAAPNGVDIDAFNVDISKEDAREEVNLPKDKQILMYVGSLYKWKGVDFVISAWNEKLHKDDNLCLVFVGGHAEDRDRLKENLAYPDRVHFIPPVKHKQVPVYLKSADVLLLPSTAESEESAKYTSPIKLFEYLAAKRLVIAADLPSIQQLVTKQEVSFFEADNTGDLASTVKHTLESDNEHKIVSAFKKSKQYTWKQRAERILLALQDEVKLLN